MRFQGKVVVVTGAGAGIGKGIALGFGREGASVVLAEVNAESGKAAEHELRQLGVDARFMQTDVSDAEQVRQTMARAADQWSGIDAVINNAGIALWKGVKDLDSEEWDRVLGVDLKGVFLTAKYAAPFMKQSSVRSIVNISSVHAYATVPHYDAYAASKGGVVSLTRSMALTLKEDGIRVNGICPGFIDTEMYRRYVDSLEDPAAYERYVLSLHTVGRIGTPDDIARSCLFLCSEDAAFINGTMITIDGGLSIQLKH
ncbi:MAG: SDR family oxidoreductase [Paenibacillaceae bacterium]|nr:SDR family oxidoreductase [Paenibacillaceae bacterium]